MSQRAVSGSIASATTGGTFVVTKGQVQIDLFANGGNATVDIERSPDGGTTWYKVDEGGAKATRTLTNADKRTLVLEEYEDGGLTQTLKIRLNVTALSAGTLDFRIAQ